MQYRVLSLFSGMGGMDVGFSEQVVVHKDSVPPEYVDSPADTEDFVNLKRLPFTTVFQNDILPEAKDLADANGWSHNYVLQDIRELLQNGYAFPEAEVVTGGFPCQDFSHAGKRKGFDSARGTLYQSFIEVVRRVKPLVFVAENVNGLLTMPGAIDTIVGDFAAAGYEVQYQRIKCEEIGVPQTRWRVLIFGVRADKRDRLPETWNLLVGPPVQCPIGPYFRHLAEPDVTTDPGQKCYSKAARLDKGQGQKEIVLTEPAPTMRAEHHGNIEFRRITDGKNGENLPERRLTVREAALIQTFPPTCYLTNPQRPNQRAYKPIGNAVPPLLGYRIALTVHRILSLIQD